MLEITSCTTQTDFSLALQLTRDYLRWLDMDLSFQDIDEELANFAGMYGAPNGLYLLAREAGKLAGGVGMRKLTPQICEMKRLFVYDGYQGRGVGTRLCSALIREAKRRGYRKMRLDTLGRMQPAIRLYENLGFKEIGPYRYNPDPTAKYLELRLERGRQAAT